MHATICDMITDLVQNAIEAQATEITLSIGQAGPDLRVEIADNGKGMDAETLEKARDPFFSDGQKHKHRKVGLGLPFLFQTAEATGGTATIASEKGRGTSVAFHLDLDHVDVPAFGSFATAAVALMAYGFEGNLSIRRRKDGKNYRVDKAEILEALGDLDEAGSLALLRRFIQANEEDLQDPAGPADLPGPVI